MEITRTLRVSDREAWRAWLAEHHATETEVWLVYPRKATGQPRIAYNDAVEEALCFGWIDSTQKTLDADATAQRFTPRRPGVPYSQPNRERLRRMIALGRVAEHVLQSLRGVDLESFEIAPDILRALQAEPAAWENLRRWSDSYRRIRVAYVEDARDRRPDEFQKRLRNLVRKSAQGKQFGFGIETYF
jgi:uncharacterized protein YdeI (YjbR/CyaY-like superfamily)